MTFDVQNKSGPGYLSLGQRSVRKFGYQLLFVTNKTQTIDPYLFLWTGHTKIDRRYLYIYTSTHNFISLVIVVIIIILCLVRIYGTCKHSTSQKNEWHAMPMYLIVSIINLFFGFCQRRHADDDNCFLMVEQFLVPFLQYR